MATFNILSSCICRDVFGICEKNEHEVIHFLQSSSPMTWFELNDKPGRELTMDDFGNIAALSNFQKKCIINDYNKTVLKQYTTKADCFITDLVSFAGTGLGRHVYPDKHEHFFTYSKWFKRAYTDGLKNVLKGKVEKYNHFKLITDEFISKTVGNYIEWIKSLGYSSKQIILVENKKVNCYSDGKLLYYFTYDKSRDIKNEILDKIYAEFERQMPDCYIVKMPFGVYGDTNHVWGLSDLHFCKDYYEYLYKCFDMVVKIPNCQAKINRLRDRYSEKFQRVRDILTYNSFEYITGRQLLSCLPYDNIVANHIVPIGTDYYDTSACNSTLGKLDEYIVAEPFSKSVLIITLDNKQYFVKKDDCKRGFIGNGIYLNTWKTVGDDTLILMKDDSLVIGHLKCTLNSQAPIIQTIDNADELAGKVVTFSVYARVLCKSNSKKGGTIAIINADDYNKGLFYAKIDFTNPDWQRIRITTTLPEKEKFRGLTVCMCAATDNAIVEYSEPKLELGSFSTNSGYTPPQLFNT